VPHEEPDNTPEQAPPPPEAPEVPEAAAEVARQRDAATGCLLALVLEAAALLGGLLWLVGALAGLPAAARAGAFGFWAFTLAAAATGVALVIFGRDFGRRRRREQPRQPRGR